MTKKLAITAIFIVFAIATHAYLTTHYYPLKLGMSTGKSFCNVSDTMDCDVAAASPYSDVFGIPLSVFGLVFHVILLALLFTSWTGLTEHQERTLRQAFHLSLLSVFISIAMAVISATQLSAWCPFCIAAYVWSFLITATLFTAIDNPFGDLAGDISALFGQTKATLIALAVIPVASWFMHKSIIQSYGAEKLGVVIKSSLADWLSGPQYQFMTQPALQAGSGEKPFELVEFADFRCGHCGQAAPSLQAFKKAHPNITFKFYNFPLDGGCNEAIPREGDGVSCRLAKAVTCAFEKDQASGWKLHDSIFANQREFQQLRSVSDADAKLKESFATYNLDAEAMTTCMDSEETLAKVKEQAQMGKDAKIQGTPTIFANGRKLPRGQLLPVLNGAFEKAMATNR